MKTNLVLIIALASTGLLFAQEGKTDDKQKSTTKSGGPFEKYDQLKRDHEAARLGEGRSEAQERNSLTEAMKQSLRRIYNLKDYDKIQPGDIQYERPDEKSNVYYVTYKDFAARFRFRNDPGLYSAYPAEADVLTAPGARPEQGPSLFGKEEKESKPAASSKPQGK